MYPKDITWSQNEQVILTSVLQYSQFYMNGHTVTPKITGIHSIFYQERKRPTSDLSVPNTCDNLACSLVIWRLTHLPHNNNWIS